MASVKDNNGFVPSQSCGAQDPTRAAPEALPSASVAHTLAVAVETAAYLRERSDRFPGGNAAGIALLAAAQGWEWFAMRLRQTTPTSGEAQ